MWAREHGCPWDKNTCSAAVDFGHVDVLRWARQHGCDWDPLACRRRAVRNPDMMTLIEQLGG